MKKGFLNKIKSLLSLTLALAIAVPVPVFAKDPDYKPLSDSSRQVQAVDKLFQKELPQCFAANTEESSDTNNATAENTDDQAKQERISQEKAERLRILARKVAVLEPTVYGMTLVRMVECYIEQPSARNGVELVFNEVYAKVKPELDRETVQQAIDEGFRDALIFTLGAIIVTLIAKKWGGAIAERAEGLAGRFGERVSSVFSNFKNLGVPTNRITDAQVRSAMAASQEAGHAVATLAVEEQFAIHRNALEAKQAFDAWQTTARNQVEELMAKSLHPAVEITQNEINSVYEILRQRPSLHRVAANNQWAIFGGKEIEFPSELIQAAKTSANLDRSNLQAALLQIEEQLSLQTNHWSALNGTFRIGRENVEVLIENFLKKPRTIEIPNINGEFVTPPDALSSNLASLPGRQISWGESLRAFLTSTNTISTAAFFGPYIYRVWSAMGERRINPKQLLNGAKIGVLNKLMLNAVYINQFATELQSRLATRTPQPTPEEFRGTIISLVNEPVLQVLLEHNNIRPLDVASLEQKSAPELVSTLQSFFADNIKHIEEELGQFGADAQNLTPPQDSNARMALESGLQNHAPVWGLTAPPQVIRNMLGAAAEKLNQIQGSFEAMQTLFPQTGDEQ